MAHDVHDHYFHEARRQGYRSRAAFKLIEIDDRRKVLGKGEKVLDCGAAPGSWLQVAAQRVGENGVVVGIDLEPIAGNFREPNIVTVQGDLREIDVNELLQAASTTAQYDVVLSDMAPGTTGDSTRDHHRSARLCRALLERCPALLRPGGNLVMKVYEGETYPDLLLTMKRSFDRVKGFKPKATRSESVEMYLIAHGHRVTSMDRDQSTTVNLPPARPKPSAGWGARGAD